MTDLPYRELGLLIRTTAEIKLTFPCNPLAFENGFSADFPGLAWQGASSGGRPFSFGPSSTPIAPLAAMLFGRSCSGGGASSSSTLWQEAQELSATFPALPVEIPLKGLGRPFSFTGPLGSSSESSEDSAPYGTKMLELSLDLPLTTGVGGGSLAGWGLGILLAAETAEALEVDCPTEGLETVEEGTDLLRFSVEQLL